MNPIQPGSPRPTDLPWFIHHTDRHIVMHDYGELAQFERLADAKRTIACVTACAGIPDPAQALELARKVLRGAVDNLRSRRLGCGQLDDALSAITPTKE